MNRRSLLTNIAGAIAATTGIKSNVVAVDAEPMPIAFKVTLPVECQIPTLAESLRIQETVKRHFAGTPYAKVPVFILHPGMDFQAVTGEGEQCVITERCGDYEWSVKGRTGAEAIEMLGQINFASPGWPIVGRGSKPTNPQ